MLSEICHEINNWFTVKKFYGTCRIIGGKISETSDMKDENGRSLSLSQSQEIPDIQPGQYFRIVGSVFNDGVNQYLSTDLIDEVFEGAIWTMAVPPDFIDLVTEIENWQKQYGEAASGPYSSEYAYTKATSSGGDGDSSVTWKSSFAGRLNKWRRVRGIV